MSSDKPKTTRSPFPPLYWLVVVFEFFERGSYYGVMSVLSVYLTDELGFSKPDVGIIKGTIQPLLYFLPIIAGALADRFGYRRALLVAFSFLGAGYAIASQTTGYAAVFLALVVMGIGAGTFKPVVSGTIARCTDKTNSTLGFGIFYWSINLGAFLFPLILVPYLKGALGYPWVMIAAAIGTGSMLLPTLAFFREPPAPREEPGKQKPRLLQTLANAFEIIYSPFVLLNAAMRRGGASALAGFGLLAALLGGGGWLFFRPAGGPTNLAEVPPPDGAAAAAASRPFLPLFIGLLFLSSLLVFRLVARYRARARAVQAADQAAREAGSQASSILLALLAWAAVLGGLFLAGRLSLFATILCGVIVTTQLALFAIDTSETDRFRDHFRFLLMIFIYSGFWVLYFQMFDSVLWYVKAYVDASSLNAAVNGLLGAMGLNASWRFDVEHVTVINAGTIILLQILVSTIVKNTKALPTMIAGIALGTCGMAILSFSSGIWIFILGITIFSIGEMTAHPKFISYVGQTAPPSRVAMYMGYLFLYGVIGSSIGAPLGATLYVKLVDEMQSPRLLWLIFSAIGVATIIGLLIYNKLVKRPEPQESQASS